MIEVMSVVIGFIMAFRAEVRSFVLVNFEVFCDFGGS